MTRQGCGEGESQPEGYKLGTVARDEASRMSKARKLLALLEREIDLRDARVLDIGTGAGYIASALAKRARGVESVDIVDDRIVADGYRQTIVADENLPFEDDAFDVVVSNHVIEHVHDQERHLREVRRVVKDTGTVYLATPNRLWFRDPHYGLPFINWLPQCIADIYLRQFRNRRWDIRPVSPRRLKRLAGTQGLRLEDQLWVILGEPERYGVVLPAWLVAVLRRTPSPMRSLLTVIAPTQVKLLRPQGPPRP